RLRLMMKRVAFILVLMGCAAVGAAAETLLRYENRVARAVEQVARIRSDAEYEESGIEDIKQLLPRRDQVQFEGKTLTVGNTWLYDELDDYLNQSDPQRKQAKLGKIGDRLAALDSALIRAAETSSDKGGNEAARDKVREILNRREYHEKEESRIAA